jgi:EAL domain-containing protein (putative c-di-GMP-specific phosphodiesterase class I)
MTEALENHEFKVFLQPKMNMFTDKVIGAEALVRWFKPDGTMVSPGEFIPIFEENGFVTHLDFEMLRQVLEMQQHRLQEGKPIVNISVNFSRKHQENQVYLNRLDELMAQYDVPAKSLEIEITESVFMQDLAPLIDSICQLKKRGFSVSIDDFGAGYSSLNVLSRVKADIVKLDRQFLLDVEMEKDNFSSEFLQLLINMIKKLGFNVLAEGVETAEQVTLLKNAGCRFAQGFYYARPMPINEFLEFLDRHEIEEES